MAQQVTQATPKPNDGQPDTNLLPYAGEVGKCAKCGKPLIMGKAGDVGRTCAAHMGKLGTYYKTLTNAPTEATHVTLSSLCRMAEGKGRTAYFVVKLTGKDGGAQPPADPVWQVYLWQGRKYLAIGAKQALLALLPK